MCYAGAMTDITSLLEDLMDKWADIRDTTDERAEKTLASEVLEDLEEVSHVWRATL